MRAGLLLACTALLLAGAAAAKPPLPAWVKKAIAQEKQSPEPGWVAECVYDGKRAFQITHGDVFDTGGEHILYDVAGKEICRFGGIASQVTSGACYLDKLECTHDLVDE